jgi:hypothetical protein
MFKRDDIIFGPRPSFQQLLRSGISSRAGTFRAQALIVVGLGALATIPSMVFPTLFLLPSVALLGRTGLLAGLLFAAVVEEYFKPYGVYLLSTRLSFRRVAFLGVLAGLAFSAVENALITLALMGTGALHGGLMAFRYMVAPMVHMGLTLMVVVGYRGGGTRRLAALAVASLLHSAYNLAAMMWVG